MENLKRSEPSEGKTKEPKGEPIGVKRGFNSVLDLKLDLKDKAHDEPSTDKGRGKKRKKLKAYRGANARKLGLLYDDSPRLVLPGKGKDAETADPQTEDGVEREVPIFFKCCCSCSKGSVATPGRPRDTNPDLNKKRKRPYKLEAWVVHFEEALLLIREAWQEQCPGSRMYQLCRKIQLVRNKLLNWCCKWKASRSVQWEDFQRSLTEVQLALTTDGEQQDLLAKDKQLRHKLQQEAKVQWLFWKQRAKYRWDKLGDAVTSLFFRSVKERKAKNSIMALQQEEGECILDEERIAAEFKHYFNNIYKCNPPEVESSDSMHNSNPLMEEWLQHLPELTLSQLQVLNEDFLDKEIRDVVFSMAPLKALGPDGCPPILIQKCWNFMGPDICVTVKSFFHGGSLLRELNMTFLCLLPKDATKGEAGEEARDIFGMPHGHRWEIDKCSQFPSGRGSSESPLMEIPVPFQASKLVLTNYILIAILSHIMSVYLLPKKIIQKLTSSCLQFFWALLFKQAWRVHKEGNSLVSKVLKGKYRYSPVDLAKRNKVPSIVSWAYISMIKAAQQMKEGVGKCISNGRNTSITDDIWLKGGRVTFKDSIGDLVWRLFPFHTARNILCTPTLPTPEEDGDIWVTEVTGNYSTKSGDVRVQKVISRIGELLSMMHVRNEVTFGNASPDPRRIMALLEELVSELKEHKSKEEERPRETGELTLLWATGTCEEGSLLSIFTDVSWKKDKGGKIMAGIGWVIMKEHTEIERGGKAVMAQSPLQSELLAIKEGVLHAQGLSKSIEVCIDSMIARQCIQHPKDAPWDVRDEMSSWTNFLQSSHEYEKGVEDYLDKAFSTRAIGDQITCPCKACYHRFWHRKQTVFNHLIANGIEPGTEGWHCYEKGMSTASNTKKDVEDMHDNIERLIYDVHKDVAERYEGVGDEPNDEAKKFYKLVEDGKQELYPGWKETQTESQQDISNQPSKKVHQVPEKVLWHFPLKPRLLRLYMCSETANLMRWHDEERNKDELLRHPADGEAWKEFDQKYSDFANDARNVRLGLASDGFNPFQTMSTQHSNLPPWLCMKPEFLMLSLLIPGPTSPGNDIDVYLQPLVQELKDLWEYRLDTYDAEKRQTFKMHAALQSTTSDFPGYAMLSSWSTKGKFACPYCHYKTDHHHLSNSNKSCYWAHRRWYLNASVKKRSKWFNKSQEKTDEIDKESPSFPKAGYPLGRKKKGKKKGKAYTLDSDTMALAHRYVLFNCEDDQVENYIK
uniref:Transposase-associated domain-containing protein n=1 Tax=Chenopodium quinoa TaxID=63459 RepID=A0A803MDX1_CHEQI